MNPQLTYAQAKQNWREAITAGKAVSAARDCVAALGRFAEEQEAGATKWVAMAHSDEPHIGTDEFCIEQGRLCNGTAANARRHAEAFRRWADEASRRFKPDDLGQKARHEVQWALPD